MRGALSQLVRTLLTQSEERAAAWRRRIVEALGANARVIVDVVPDLALLLGDTPAVPLLPPSEAQARFHLTFQAFVRVLAQPDHPLALFLDDLQWADEASLKLLQTLLGETGTPHLLVVCAYRDNEVTASHPLMLLLDGLRAGGLDVRDVALQPLTAREVGRLVADTVMRPPEACSALAEIVWDRTKGNPFFVNQLLKAMYQDGMLEFDEENAIWRWDPARLREVSYTDNVVDFMAGEVHKLPEDTRTALALAACIGNPFDLKTLAAVHGDTESETVAHLWPAVRLGLVLPISDSYKYVEAGDMAVSYRFLHDRVQQGVDSLLSDDRRGQVHLAIGRLWREHGVPDERVFDVANHFNQAVDLVTDPSERRGLAELNLAAGVRAKNATAYEAALQHLRVGTDLLEDAAWDRDYALAFPLHRERSECECLCGHFDAAETLFEKLMGRARTRLDAAEVCALRVLVYSTMNRLGEAVDVALAGLRRFGVRLPAAPAMTDILLEVLKARWNLGWRKVSDLLDAPILSDPEQQAVMGLLGRLTPAAYLIGNQELLTLAILKMVNVSLRHGNSEISSHAYCLYGMIVGSALGDYALGHEFGTMALRLNEKFDYPPVVCRLKHVFATFVHPWRERIRGGDPYFREAYLAGLRTGDVVYGGWAVFNQSVYSLVRGERLETVMESLEQYWDFLHWTRDRSRFEMARLLRQMIRCLRGQTENPTVLNGDGFDEEEYLGQMRADNFQSGLCWYYLAKARLMLIAGEHRGALEMSEQAQGVIKALFGTPYVVEGAFCHALAITALPESAVRDGAALRKTLAGHRRALGRWAAACPQNYRHMHLLVEAEAERVAGRDAGAARRYDEAIDAAAEAGFIQNEALAAERAGRFHLARGRRRLAPAYLTAACRAYAAWGANARADALRREHAELLAGLVADEAAGSETALDVSTLLKASQAISEEMVLSQVLRRLMHSLMENAGAQRVVLLLSRDGRLVVEAEGQLDGAERMVAGEIPAAEFARLPAGIIHLVERSREPLVVANAATDPLFCDDPYIREHGPRSVMCAPILNQGALTGLVYLENHLIPDAFTPARLEVLRMLSSQAAISIQNAQLYRKLEDHSHTLERRVQERTEELSDKNARLEETLTQLREMQNQVILQQKLAYLGTLTAGIAHEIKNPLNFVNNFAELSADLLQELHEALAAESGSMSVDSWENLAGIQEVLKQNLEKILHHGRRADGIVNGMLMQARTSTDAPEPTQLNDLVTECIELARFGAHAGKEPRPRVKVTARLDESAPQVRAVARDLSHALVNIINNACYAAREKAALAENGFQPAVDIGTCDLGERVEIRVRDNGNGIPADIRDRIFNPFFTTKPAGQGTGLGLAISFDIIVGQHQGEIDVESREGEYAEFILRLAKA